MVETAQNQRTKQVKGFKILLDKNKDVLEDDDIVLISILGTVRLGIYNADLHRFDIIGKPTYLRFSKYLKDDINNPSYIVTKYYETRKENAEGISLIIKSKAKK
jgi:hypothetical protein